MDITIVLTTTKHKYHTSDTPVASAAACWPPAPSARCYTWGAGAGTAPLESSPPMPASSARQKHASEWPSHTGCNPEPTRRSSDRTACLRRSQATGSKGCPPVQGVWTAVSVYGGSWGSPWVHGHRAVPAHTSLRLCYFCIHHTVRLYMHTTCMLTLRKHYVKYWNMR